MAGKRNRVDAANPTTKSPVGMDAGGAATAPFPVFEPLDEVPPDDVSVPVSGRALRSVGE